MVVTLSFRGLEIETAALQSRRATLWKSSSMQDMTEDDESRVTLEPARQSEDGSKRNAARFSRWYAAGIGIAELIEKSSRHLYFTMQMVARKQ